MKATKIHLGAWRISFKPFPMYSLREKKSSVPRIFSALRQSTSCHSKLKPYNVPKSDREVVGTDIGMHGGAHANSSGLTSLLHPE